MVCEISNQERVGPNRCSQHTRCQHRETTACVDARYRFGPPSPNAYLYYFPSQLSRRRFICDITGLRDRFARLLRIPALIR